MHGTHAATLDRVRPLHRLFQVSLGILGAQHPAIRDACGGHVTWSPLVRPGGGVVFHGPRARWAVVPTLEGAWSPVSAPVDVVRAVDDTVDAMLRTAPKAMQSARPGKSGNQLARGFFYMQRGLTEEQFVTQYLEFLSATPTPPALTALFGPRLNG